MWSFYPGLIIHLDAVGKDELVLTWIRAQTIFNEYDVITTMLGKTVLKDRKVNFRQPFAQLIYRMHICSSEVRCCLPPNLSI
jgi:hypothetical protein